LSGAYRCVYFYHGDHLGSSNYITDRTGRVFEHTIYLPYGETWIDEGHETSLLGYKFTGKELDEETGLYYFGARYYDPQMSTWISTDPALPEYLPTGLQLYFPDKAFSANSLKGAGGVFNSKNLNLYHYASLNPVKYVDPNGREVNKTDVLSSGANLVFSANEIAIGVGLAVAGAALISGGAVLTGSALLAVGVLFNTKAVGDLVVNGANLAISLAGNKPGPDSILGLLFGDSITVDAINLAAGAGVGKLPTKLESKVSKWADKASTMVGSIKLFLRGMKENILNKGKSPDEIKTPTSPETPREDNKQNDKRPLPGLITA